MTQANKGPMIRAQRIKGDKRASDLDRAIVAALETQTRTAVAAEHGLTVGQLHVIVQRVRRDVRGRELLAKDLESLEGLGLIGEIPDPAWRTLHYLNHHWSNPVVMERISDVTAAGRDFIRNHLKPKPMAQLEEYLALKGLTWSSNPRVIERPKPQQPQGQDDQRAERWGEILHRVAQLEHAAGTSILENSPGRDSMQGVAMRLAFLNGYFGAKAKHEGNMRDVTPRAEDDGGYETAGNLICLPGVKLADVQGRGDGERP